MELKKIIIKCCNSSGFLRTEALKKAIEFEAEYSKTKKIGINNGVLWVLDISGEKSKEWQMYVYHTKTAIIVSVKMIKKQQP